MKRFIFSVLAVSVFCIGLGSLAERAGANFRSDERALAIIRDARQAIGGETALAAIRGMVITGQTTRTVKIDGVEKTLQGDTEIAMQLPDKLMKMIKIGHGEGLTGDKLVQRQVDVVVVGDKAKIDAPNGGEQLRKIVVKKPDGTTQEIIGGDDEKIVLRKTEGDDGQVRAEIEKAISAGDDKVMFKRVGGPEHDAMRQNEMLRMTLALLLTAPQGMDVSYTYAGQSDMDGTACNVVVAEFGGSSFKLFIGRSSNLPVAIGYKGAVMPKVMMFRTKESGAQKEVTFTRKVEGSPAGMADLIVKFADYRSVGGVQLPFKWTQTANGVVDETFDVANYEVNPANLAEKFNNSQVRVKTKAE